MSTPNFKKQNAKNYYVVEREDSWDYKMFEDDMPEMAKQIDVFKANNCRIEPMDDYDHDMSYPTHYNTLVWDDIVKSNVGATIKAQIGITSGYYQAANLDYNIIVYCDATRDEFYLSDYDGNVEDMVESMLGYYKKNEDWQWECRSITAGLFKMNKAKIVKAFVKKIEDIVEGCEQLCKNACDEVYGCVGVFSNGEAIYEKCNAE